MTDKAALIQKRGRVKATLTRIRAFAADITPEVDDEEINVRLGKLEELWGEFQDLEDELVIIDGQLSEMEEFERKFFETKALLKRAWNTRVPLETTQGIPAPHTQSTMRVANLSSSSNQSATGHINLTSFNQTASVTSRLPKLVIPPFSGNYKEWPSFKDLFQSSVHNNEGLTGAQKFQFLKGLLQGDAASLVRHLNVTDANYVEAWTKLTKRFDKTSCIATSYIKTFFDMSPINSPTSKSLRNLCDTSDEVMRGLRALGELAEGRDPWLLYIINTKLDSDTRELWSREIADNDFPTFDQFLSFLNRRCNALELSATFLRRAQSSSRSVHTVAIATRSCPKCGSSHMLYQCERFKTEPIHLRREFVMLKSLCFKCLGADHTVKKCRTRIHCNKCSGAHHPLLHLPKDSSTSSRSSTNEATVSSNLAALNQTLTTVISLLPTAVAYITTDTKVLIPCRVLLDSGSQISLISEPFAQKLKFKRSHARLVVNGLSGCNSGVTRGKFTIEINSRCYQNQGVKAEVYVIEKLTSPIPSAAVDRSITNVMQNLPLADPSFHEPSSIDMILGADQFFNVLKENKIQDNDGNVIAYETIFGWVITGQVPSTTISDVSVNVHVQTLEDIDKSLRQFWELEEISLKERLYSEEERKCEEHFTQHVIRHGNRFIVSLPFKTLAPTFGNSLNNALKRLYAMERKFERDLSFKAEYIKFMQEYEQLGHMELIPQHEVAIANCFYLPHHAVFKLSPVPKIRVVFDGLCKSSNGQSLNDELMVGPTIQPDLTSIFTRFRKHIVAFSADVEKMYRQVLVVEKDRDYQRIVMRERPSDPIKHYRLRTVTYGTACAPYLAIRSLQQVAEDNTSSFPKAAAVIRSDFYVDDLLTGADTVAEAHTLKVEIEQVLASRGFRLSKWLSNSHTFRQLCNVEDQPLKPLVSDERSATQKVLGIQWDPDEDTFSYAVSLSVNKATTKRGILSESSKIFDPLGWLSPVTISVKILLQKLWLSKFDWDDTLPEETIQKWEMIRLQMPLLRSIRVPRCIVTTCVDKCQLQIHGFSDASESAYSAVIYCRSVNSTHDITVRIISAKTKVAPLKQMSLPRLELCGALLLTRLLKKSLDSLTLHNVEVYAWTDSSIVLAWLSDLPGKWKTFVGNRTSEILETVPRKQWNHVPSKDNPADVASRGIWPEDLIKSKIWWNGPDWLCQNKECWPSSRISHVNTESCILERKGVVVSYCQQLNTDDFSYLFNKVSSFSKVIRIIGYCFRFVHNVKNSSKDMARVTTGVWKSLSAQELRIATNACFRIVQHAIFKMEITALRASRPVHQKSAIAKLHPFLDKSGLLRVGGRLRNAECGYDVKHPIILPKDHTIGHLLVQELHRTYLHPGPTLLMGLIRQRFWILGMRSLVKRVTRSCLVCFRHRSTTTSQLMANLPSARVQISRPFSKVGVDYAGPVKLCYVVSRGVRPIKGYFALFVCMCTKAIHLEPVTSLTAEAFIACLRRFIGRRGIPCQILSDNGTNFIGAHRQINEMHKLALSVYNDSKMAAFLSDNQIDWRFNPPSAPHFGGLWEAGVKSVKWHIQRVIGETTLSFEEFTTLLAQIEAILNSRPYGAISDDPDDLNVLTPSHFLIGQPLTALPEPDVTSVKLPRLGRWQHLQTMVQGFWNKWSKEYLTSLHQRTKWNVPQQSIQKGDLVVIQEDNMPPTRWLLGRIVEVHPGADSLVRVAIVKTRSGICKRPITKLHKLPIS